MKKMTAICLALVCLFYYAARMPVSSLAEEQMEIQVSSLTRFTNALSRYVEFRTDFSGASRFVVRVYDPQGKQASFRNRNLVNKKMNPVKSTVNTSRNKETGMVEMNVFFPKGRTPGVWTITVTGQDKGKNDVASATVQIEVMEPYEIVPLKYLQAHDMLLAEGEEVQKGKIRFITQLPEDPCYKKSYWKSLYYDLTDESRSKCTRAAFSMALSYLGIDCTPVHMSDIAKNKELFYTYDAVLNALKNVSRIDGNLEQLWSNYKKEEGDYSPVAIHFSYGSDGMHSLLLIDRDDENPNLYYAITSSEGTKATAWGGSAHDHVIMVVIEDGRVGQPIQSPMITKYNGGKIDVICQWKRTELYYR